MNPLLNVNKLQSVNKLKILLTLRSLSLSKYLVHLEDPEIIWNYVHAVVAFSDKGGAHSWVGLWMLLWEEGKGYSHH